MFYRFRFEVAQDPELNRVPLHLRMKLDLTGIKISLQDWLVFGLPERTALCHLPVDTNDETRAFVAFVDFLCRKYRGTPARVTEAANRIIWDTTDRLPGAVNEINSRLNQPVSLAEWQAWNSDQRYALYKTAISRSEPEAFYSVLDELREGNAPPSQSHA